MKKVFALLMMAVLAGCSKSVPHPGISYIKYQYTANVSSTYVITYTDQNNNTQTVNFTGTTWSQSITAPLEGGLMNISFNDAYFTLTSTAAPTPTLTGKMTISANNNVVTEADVVLMPNGKLYYSIDYFPFD